MTPTVDASLGSESLQQLFAITKDELASGLTADKLANAASEERENFGAWLSSASWPSVSHGIATQLTTFLQEDLAGIFAGCWVKYTELKKAAEESIKDPHSNTSVTLAEHEFSWEMSPSVEIKLNAVTLTKIPFGISFAFKVSGLTLSIATGAVQEFLTGTCECTGEIRCGGQPVWSKSLFGVDLPGKLRLKHPIQLADTTTEAAKR